MIIGYDGLEAITDINRSGNYSRLLIEGIAEDNSGDTLFLYTHRKDDSPHVGLLTDRHNVEIRYPAPQGLKGRAWHNFGITNHLRADKVDIFHGPDNRLPLNIRSGGVPAVVTIQDMSHRCMPELHSPLSRATRDFICGRSCRNADHIIAVSGSVRDDVVRFYGINPDKVSVIYPTFQPCFGSKRKHGSIDILRSRLNLPDRYILQVGAVEKRNNLELTVRSLSNISPDMSLVVIGKGDRAYRRSIEKLAEVSGVRNRLHFIENLPSEELSCVFEGAEILIHPSRYEGFSPTILEGLESGIPVIAAAGNGMEESGGPDTIYIDPDDPADLIQAIHSILSDPAAARMMAAAGKEYARGLRNEKATSKIRRIYEFTIENYKSNIFP